MELRLLKYFLAIANEGNISKAAETLHLTQPTLSRQLVDLEHEVGKKLFHRGRHISLTEEGRILQRRAEEILNLVDKTKNELNQTDELTGSITIGSGVYSASTELIRNLEEFSQLYPKVQYEIYTNSADTLQEKLDQGLLDFALLQEPVDIINYDFLRLKTKDAWGLLMRTDSSLAAKFSIAREDLIGRRLGSARRLHIRREIENWIGDTHDLNIIATFNLIDNALPLIVDGFIEVITIDGAVCCYDPNTFTFRPFDPPLETSTVLVWKRLFPIFGAAKLFAQFLKDKYNSTERGINCEENFNCCTTQSRKTKIH